MKRSECLAGIRRDVAGIRTFLVACGDVREAPALVMAEWLLRDRDTLWPIVDAAIALDDAVAEFGAKPEYVGEHFQNLSDAIEKSRIREDEEPR